MRILLLVLTTLFLSCGSNQPAIDLASNRATQPSLAILGDSISTGVLASTNFGQLPGQKIYTKLGSYISSAKFSADAFQKEFSEPKHAAATTAEDWGLPKKIALMADADLETLKVFPELKFGGRLMHVPSAIKSLQETYKKKNEGKPADYVFVMFGGNDFCANKSKDEFSDEFAKAMSLIKESHPESTVIISKVAPMQHLKKYEHTYKTKIAGVETNLFTCKDFRKKYCKAFYSENIEERINDYNAVISEKAPKAQEGFGGKILIAEKVAELDFNAEALSFDCFHPSLAGQKTLGEAIHASF